ncbi:hypothetical protein BGZ83_005495 [Gryganskiella cystojenkinii]|nr:hypothetical protein BGZ83_005495 [Gryganskiella cystojenkinii]
MVPSNVDTDMQATSPPVPTADVNALKDKDALTARVDDVTTKPDPPASSSPQTIIPASVQTAKSASEIDQAGKTNSYPPPPASPVSEAAPLQSDLQQSDEEKTLPKATVTNATTATAKGHQTPEPDSEQKPKRRRRPAAPKPPAADQDNEMNDSLPTPTPTDLDSRMQSEDKYKRLKRKLKEVLEENERLSVELDRSNRRARNLRKEKNLLLDRLCTYERDSDSSPDTLSSLSSDSELSDSSIPGGFRSRRATSPTRPAPSIPSRLLQVPGSTNDTPTSSAHIGQHPKKTATKPSQKRRSPVVPKEAPPPPVASTITNVGSATQKPKRIHHSTKQRPNLNKVRKVQTLEKDENGNIKLPVTIGIITIMSIGHVVYDREAFHNERYIWPVGYKMSRSYNSMIDPNNQTVYTCSVIDDGDAPKFQIDAEDQPDKPIIAGTATGAWTHVVKAANGIRKRDHSNSASGPDYFGFSNPTIAKMIQDLPNVEKCPGYIMQKFEEPSAAPATLSAKPEKRKASTLKSEADGEHEGEEDQLEEEDEEEYASLGTPGKKKVKRSPSPKIRHAGFDIPQSVETLEEEEEEIDQLEDDYGEDVVSEMDGVEATMPAEATNPDTVQKVTSTSSTEPVAVAAVPEKPAAPVVAAPTSDSELVDVEHEVDELVDDTEAEAE